MVARPGQREIGGRVAPRADLVQGKGSIRPQDAADLGKELFLILDVHDRVLGPRRVKVPILEGQVRHVPLPEGHHLAQAHPFGQHRRAPAVLLNEVDPTYPAPELGRQRPGGSPHPAAEVKNLHPFTQVCQPRKLPRRVAPPDMELVE